MTPSIRDIPGYSSPRQNLWSRFAQPVLGEWLSRRAAILILLAAASLGACATQVPRHALPPGAKAQQRLEQADARFQAALQRMKQGDTQAAQQEFLALSKEYPELSGPLIDLGILYARGRRTPEALASLEQAVAANPRNVVAYNWLGVLYRESGQHTRAEQAYLKALALQPRYAAAHLNLAILYDVWMHRKSEALAHYRAYLGHAAEPRVIVRAWLRELESGAEEPRTVAEAAP